MLFTVLALTGAIAIWTVTLSLTTREREAAEVTAAGLVADEADTYEAQVVRALREIDQALQLVQHELGRTAATAPTVLDQLRRRELLPSGFLFDFSVVAMGGEPLASTGEPPPRPVAKELLARAAGPDGMALGRPHRSESGGFRVHFARALEQQRHGVAGGVVGSVHAGYFVSGYEPEVLGNEGVLGLIGGDGVFRARRSGRTVSAGERVDRPSATSGDGDSARLRVNGWDGVERYTIMRELFGYPASIVVGVSRAEQMAPTRAGIASYVRRASAATAGFLALVAWLGYLSWGLQRAQARLVEERVSHAEHAEHLAFHDNLTGLPNRAYFSNLLAHSMEHARRYDSRLALLFLDLDRFKAINDSLGHDAGDELLQEIGRRLRDSVRASDVVARLGGDEFVVVLPEVTSDRVITKVADKILETVGQSFTLAGHELRMTVSIGVTLFPDDGDDEQTLMKNADVAMYHAKAQGKNNFQCYSEDLNADTLERLELESRLRRAFESDELRLFYQAKRRFADGRVTGAEALLRWEHPNAGLLGPMRFISLAEESGLVVPVGRWVLREACRQQMAWQADGGPVLTMAVNLSARQFADEGLLDDVQDALDESGMPPQQLDLEITESMLMVDLERTTQILQRLRALGVRITIDDFGTGYSSLSTLKQFPVDAIKIDRAFVGDLLSSDEDIGLTDAVISVGKCLGLTVAAIGVETSAQAAHLASRRCDEYQGFFSDRPQPPEAFATFVRAQRQE